MSKRIYYIDIMKGLGILLVLLGHVTKSGPFNTWIYSFHMPLFFLISGMTCYIADNKSFVIKKVKSLLIPYFIFSFLSFIYWVLIIKTFRSDEHTVLSQFIGIFISQGGPDNHVYNIVVWFLPCLFVTEILFNFIREKAINEKLILFCVSILSILGIVVNIFVKIRLPWSIDTALMSIMFYGIGHIMCRRMNNNKLESKKLMIPTILVLLFISIFISYTNDRVDLNNGVYANYFLYYIGAFFGIGLVYCISKLVKSKIIMFLGHNSLIIMCVHEPIKRIVIKAFSIVSNMSIDMIRGNIVCNIINTIVILIITLPIIYIIKRYFPFMIGKYKGNYSFSFTKRLLGIYKDKKGLQ